MNIKEKVKGVAGILLLTFFLAFFMVPDFGGVFAIVVLLAFAYLFVKQGEDKPKEVVVSEQEQ